MSKHKSENSTVKIQSKLKFTQTVIQNCFRKQIYHRETKHCYKLVAVNRPEARMAMSSLKITF